MMYCDKCLDDCPPYDAVTGLCLNCLEKLVERRMLDSFTAEEWEEYHAQQAKQSNMLFLSLKNLKLAS